MCPKIFRPHLEYAVPVLNPYLEDDISTIEKVQERAASIPTNLRGLKDYEARLDSWGLTKLEDRRIRGDLIQMYKNLNYLEEVSFISNIRDNFSKNPYEKRGNVGNSMSMMRESLKAKNKNDNCHFVTVRHNFFANIVTEHWNKLPNIVVNAHYLNSFKKILDDK